MGYGHVEPLPSEAQLVEGLGTGGPAPGCGALAPDAPASTLGVASPTLINQANVGGNVAVGGVVQDGVDVSLKLNGADVPSAVGPNRADGTWSARIPAADFREGDNEVEAAFAGPDAPAQPQTVNVRRDTVSPGPATATPKPGLYNADQSVSLNSPEARAKLRYTLDGADPGATTGTPYDGQQIEVTSDTTIKAIVVDAAGNPGPVTALEYKVDKVAPKLEATPADGTYDSAQSLEFASDDLDAEIFYTINGGTPNKSSDLYTGPIRVAKTQSVKAIAYDAAGNASEMVESRISIRQATRTTLNVATANLKLGNYRAIGGAVGPNQEGGRVRVTIDRPAGLSDATRTFTLGAFSRYGFSYKPDAVGTYKIKASFLKDADALGSTSETKSFRVVR